MRLDQSILSVKQIPSEVLRGMRMVSARRRVSAKAWLLMTLYAALDAELSDWPQWRYQTEPGQEAELFRDGRAVAGEKRRREKEPSI